MKRTAVLACAAFALTGCTTVSSLFADADTGPTPIQQANAYVPIAHPMPSDFCDRVGSSARDQALRAGFDEATQQRIAAQNLQQCEGFNQPQYAAL